MRIVSAIAIGLLILWGIQFIYGAFIITKDIIEDKAHE